MGQAVILITFAFALLAAVTPSLSWDDLVEFMRKGNTNSAAEMMGIQPPTVVARLVATQTPSMPRDHLLTGGFANSEKIVMTIRTGAGFSTTAYRNAAHACSTLLLAQLGLRSISWHGLG